MEKERVVCDRCFYIIDKKYLSRHQKQSACIKRVEINNLRTEEQKQQWNELLKKYSDKTLKSYYIGY